METDLVQLILKFDAAAAVAMFLLCDMQFIEKVHFDTTSHAALLNWKLIKRSN